MCAVPLPRCCVLAVGLAFALSLSGCGPAPPPKREYAEVTGKVTYKGKPLEKGQVKFQPAAGAMETGDIKSDGTYSLNGVIGSNTVMITSQEEAGPMKADDPKSRQPPKTFIPPNYGTPASELKFEVKAGTNKADFDLK